MEADAQTIASEAVLIRDTYPGTIFIVEGVEDEELFLKFVSDSKAIILPVGGREMALEVADILSKEGREGYLTIVDADFWHMDGIPRLSQNILITDCHDLEMMIVASDAFDAIMRALGSRAKIATFLGTRKCGDLRNWLIDKALWIGHLRHHSHDRELHLDFEDLDFEGFVDKKSLEITVSKLVEAVLAKTKNPD